MGTERTKNICIHEYVEKYMFFLNETIFVIATEERVSEKRDFSDPEANPCSRTGFFFNFNYPFNLYQDHVCPSD